MDDWMKDGWTAGQTKDRQDTEICRLSAGQAAAESSHGGRQAAEAGERSAESGKFQGSSAIIETGRQAAGDDGKGKDPDRYSGVPSDGKITLEKCIGHFRTVTHHRMLVAEGCFQVGLYWQGLTHDLSKFSPVEFWNSVRYYQFGKQSPNNGERVVKGYSESWVHHKGHNQHHYEHWTDYNVEAAKKGEFPIRPVRMPRKFVAEMLMDRIAASKTYMKDRYTQHEPLKYYVRGRAGALMHPQTARELEGMLKILDQRGEKECFRFVRDYYLKGYPIGKEKKTIS